MFKSRFLDKRTQEKPSRKYYLVRFLLGFFVSLIVFALFQTKQFWRWELMSFDFRFELRKDAIQDKNIVLIEVADDSIAKVGRWPWDRNWHAVLVDILSKYKAKIIAFDVIFSEPSQDNIDDEAFGVAIKKAGNVFLPISFTMQTDKIDISEKLIPIEPFAKYIKGMGFINVLPDEDGVLRKANLFFRENNKIWWHLGFEIARSYLEVSPNEIEVEEGKFVKVHTKNGEIKIPLDKQNRIVVNWPGHWEDTYKHYSFVEIIESYNDILEGKIPKIDLNELKDKICIIGITAIGLYDIKPIAYQPLYPAVGTNATIINSILTNNFIRELPDSITIWAIFILGIMVSFFISMRRVLRGVLTTILLGVFWWFLGWYLFSFKGIWLNLVYPTLAILGTTSCVSIYDQIILSIDKARLFKASTIDGLTGLYNITYFNLLLETEISALKLGKIGVISVIMADIDHFKNINDTYGHQAGDYILKEIANIFKSNCRITDIVARYGGEEIIILLREANKKDALNIAEKLRMLVEKNCFKITNKQCPANVTVSFGVASYKTSESKQELISRADQGLYQAKNKGRNRVETTE
ncbi:MAG: CHASE2 domain-containing protein [Candidatus Omnitrophota bacterium]